MRYFAGVEIVSGACVGGVAGYLLDGWLDTLPLFLIICFLFGFCGGISNMFREISKVKNKNEGE